MLFNRVRSTETEGIIYHYCSPDTLLAILQSRSVRFSDINLLNDAEEVAWGYGVFERAATRLIKQEKIPPVFPVIGEEFFEKVDAVWSRMGLHWSSFIACFSSDGDSLSQWRAYADDGRGFAIGFSANRLRRWPIQMLDVLYDQEAQLDEMVVSLAAIFAELEDRGGDETEPWFFERCALLAASSVALKNPAWRDEKEVRCHHVVDVSITEDSWTLVDGGGVSDGQEVPGQPIKFQIRNGVVVPFFDMPFAVSADSQPIREIVLGPKCPSGIGNLMFLLGNLGYTGVSLRAAGSAYR